MLHSRCLTLVYHPSHLTLSPLVLIYNVHTRRGHKIPLSRIGVCPRQKSHPCVLPTRSFVGAYYAAQAGISIKAVSAPNRAFLGALLTTLENLRSTVGSSDAIAVESASSAYVENFALKVFASADDEDRRGVATRKTAKKFLAAATFFDILTVFEDRGAWEAVRFMFPFYFPREETDLLSPPSFSGLPFLACGENALRQVESRRDL